MLKKIFLLLLPFLFILCGCTKKSDKEFLNTIKERGNIIVGVSFDSKPFSFIDEKGKVQGVEADLAKELAKKILGDKNKVVFKNIYAQDRINAVSSGDVDIVISTMTITPKRKRLVNFSSPYFIAGQVLCVKKDGKIDTLDDLINKRVIVILGTTGEKNIRQIAPNALIQGFATNLEALDEFKKGFADAITTDDALLQGFVAENQDYTILPSRLTKEPYGIALKKSKETDSLKEKINEIIEEISYDGTLKAIKDKWIAN